MNKEINIDLNRIFKSGAAVMAICVLLFAVSLYWGQSMPPNYSEESNWARYPIYDEKPADVFLIGPTVDKGENGNMLADIQDGEYRKAFSNALKAHVGLYDEICDVYAPHYGQMTFPAYYSGEYEKYAEQAYRDVRAAFMNYTNAFGTSRPLIIAGYSQGADMAIRLYKEFFDEPEYMDRLVACYAVGWRVTEDDIAEYPHIKMAQAEDDIGVIVCYTCEAEHIGDSIIVPQGMKTYSINPLNWKTDGTPADKSLNKGAVYIDKYGELKWERPELTGACISAERGTLITPDVDEAEFSGHGFPDGVYHLYDVEFFYRNLQENVLTRYNAWCEAQG